MRLLITGGCGFIGSNFIQWAFEKDPAELEILNIDKMTYAGQQDIDLSASAGNRYTFVRGDIADISFLKEVITSEIDAIVNFAAESFVDRSIVDASAFIQSNVVGLHHLLQVAKERKIERFVQISTDEVYGSLESPEGCFSENDPLLPNNPYAASKASADLLIRSFIKTYQFPAIITRCCNNYGPYQFPEKFIPLMILKALSAQPLPVYGDGRQVREWIHVEDHCRAIWKILLDGKPGEIYNISSGIELTNLEVAEAILNQSGKPKTLLQHVPDRPGHDRRYAINSEKIRTELGWHAERSLLKELPDLIEWYKNRSDWWQPLLTRGGDESFGHWLREHARTGSPPPPLPQP